MLADRTGRCREDRHAHRNNPLPHWRRSNEKSQHVVTFCYFLPSTSTLILAYWTYLLTKDLPAASDGRTGTCCPYTAEFSPTRWRQKSTGIVTEQNYVTVTLCIGQLTHTGVCEVQMTLIGVCELQFSSVGCCEEGVALVVWCILQVLCGVGNGQPGEPALCQLHRHAFVRYGGTAGSVWCW